MIEPNLPPKFNTGMMKRELARKVEKSFNECEDLTERTVRCPYCNNILAVIFSDSVGHQRCKCQKCKAVTVINLAYFRRFKKATTPHRNYFGRLKVPDEEIIQ